MNAEQFVELLGAHERELFTYIYALTANWNDAQEVMQRVRIRLWQQFGKYDQDKPFGPWARAVAYYLVLAFRQEKSRRREYFAEDVLRSVSDAFEQSWGALGGRREKLQDCLERLSEERRLLVHEYYSRESPVADVAERIGMTSTALRKTLYRIRKALRDCVERSTVRSP